MIFFPESSQYPTISGGMPTHAMGTRNSYEGSGYQLKGRRQEHPLDFLAIFKVLKKYLNFGMWALFYLRNIALKFFHRVALRF